MPLFQKKPVIVEAVQFTDVPAHDPPGVFRRPEDGTPYVVTIHDQRVYLSPGDWILPEPDGVHYYPVKPDVFAATYDPVCTCRPDLPDPFTPTCPVHGPADRVASGRELLDAEQGS